MPTSLSHEQTQAELLSLSHEAELLLVEQLNLLFPLEVEVLLERAHVAYELNDGHLPLTYAVELMGRGFILDELETLWETEHDEIWEAI